MKELVRKTDFFGKSVRLTYRGQTRFKTIFGGCITILIIIGIAIQSSIELQRIVMDPNFYNKPSTYDFKYDQGFELDSLLNMPLAIRVYGVSG